MIIKGVWSQQNNQWVGLSTDPNPTDAQGAKLNDLLYWTDTGARFVYCGDVAGWIAVTPGTNSLGGGGGGGGVVTQGTATNLNATVFQPTANLLNATVVFPSAQAVTLASTTITGSVATTLSGSPAISGTVTANQGTANTSANGWPVKITDGTTVGAVKAASTAAVAADPAQVVAISPNNSVAVTIAATLPVTLTSTTITGTVAVTPPTLTKGTQGATGFSVQDLHDAGRNTRIFMLDAYTAAPLVEAVQTVVQWYSNGAIAGTAQPAVVPAGKTLRLTGYKIMYQSLATVGFAVVRIRANTVGLGVLASPLVASFEAGCAGGGGGSTQTAALTGGLMVETGDFPDGLELPTGTGLAFSMAGYGPVGTLLLAGGVRFQVFGYEY
jgi:hypothetical protein